MFHTGRNPMVVWCVRERTFWVHRARMGLVRYRGIIGSGLLLGALIGGCSIDQPKYLDPGAEETEPDDTEVISNPNRPGSRRDAGVQTQADAGHTPGVIMEPVMGTCVDGA